MLIPVAGLIGSSPAMVEVQALIARVCQHTYPVFLHGESGTGKSVTARAIHGLGPRAERPFVPVDCSALTTSLIETELFGHIKGAFTGAIQGRTGLLEAAHTGTLFLDEITDIPKETQVKLLRVLQEGQVRRVGSNDWKDIDIRVIAASNRDIQAEVRSGRFREDLYYRLIVVELQIPPLRERRSDIPQLVTNYLDKCRPHGRFVEIVSTQAWDKLMSYEWPGNIRQLENVLVRAIALGTGPILSEADLLLPSSLNFGGREGAQQSIKGMSWESAEKSLVLTAVSEAGGNIASAAKRIGISRTTIYRKLRSYADPNSYHQRSTRFAP